nr:response regulator transcription factor [Streptomyces sp. NRRL S-1824]
MVRVVVVDDEPMVCRFLRTILGSADDLDVVDEAHDGAAGVEAVVRNRPDVVLMDLRMPGMDGLTAIERITELADPPAIVVLTTFDADQYVLRALRAGAMGFLVKSTPPEELIGLVRVAAEGHTVLSPTAARRLIAASTESLSARDRARELRGVADRAGGRGTGLPRRGHVQRTDRGAAVPVGGHDQGVCVTDADKLGCMNRTQAGLIAHDAGVVGGQDG